MNGWWIGCSDSKPSALFEDTKLLREWLPQFQSLLDHDDVTAVDKVINTK
jgi:hypothetical protein